LLLGDSGKEGFTAGPRYQLLSWLDRKITKELRLFVAGAKISPGSKKITYTTEISRL
jgi:hypothetical protein